MKKLWPLLVALSLFVFGCSDGGGTETAEAPAEESTETEAEETASTSEDVTVSFAGSSTLAPVISDIGKAITDEHETWNNLDGELPEENITIYVSSGGSGAGAKAVIDGIADFGMLAREVKPEEEEAIEDFQSVKIGLDALTVSVNPDNPVLEIKDDLTTEELQKIFSGEYQLWSDLDPSLAEEEIVVVTRDLSGGAHEVFQDNVMGDVDVREDAVQAPSMGSLTQNIIDNEYAIGYASAGLVNQYEGELTPIKVDGIEASEENIISGEYFISRPLMIVYSGELTNSAQATLDAITGETGQTIIGDMGFIPTVE